MLSDKAGHPIRKGSVVDVFLNGIFTGLVVETVDPILAVAGVGKNHMPRAFVKVEIPITVSSEDGKVVAKLYVIGMAEAPQGQPADKPVLV
jgi:hypothetical protein